MPRLRNFPYMGTCSLSLAQYHAAALHTSNHDFPKPKILTPTPNQGSYPPSITIRVNGCHVLPAQTPACVDRARANVWYALTRHRAGVWSQLDLHAWRNLQKLPSLVWGTRLARDRRDGPATNQPQ